MGYREAKEDGVRTGEMKFSNCFYPPCHRCGRETFSRNYIRGYKYTCKDCKAQESIARLIKKV